MHPYITQALAAQHIRDLREQGAAARRTTEARRARRGHGPFPASRVSGRRRGAPRWA